MTDALKMAREALVTVQFGACANAHHTKRDRHGVDQPCPVEHRIRATIAAIDAQQAAPLNVDHLPGTSGDSLNDAMAWAQQAATVGAPTEFDHDIGADRFRVVKGAFWWHIRIGDGTANVGKFHSKLAAEDVALKMLTAFRDGAYMQHQRALAATPPAVQAQPVRALTDAEIERGRHETFSTDNPFCPCTDKTMRKAVRWAERALTKAWGVKLAGIGAAAQGGEHVE